MQTMFSSADQIADELALLLLHHLLPPVSDFGLQDAEAAAAASFFSSGCGFCCWPAADEAAAALS
jgi:hypothetical protein